MEGTVARSKDDPREADEVLDLAMAVIATFHQLRASGQEIGAVSAQGGGTWGVLRSLSREGPQSVPQLARARPVARQYMQKIVNQLLDEGLVVLQDNPAHQRSKLVALSDAGAAEVALLNARIQRWCHALAPELQGADLAGTGETLRRLRTALAKVPPPKEG